MNRADRVRLGTSRTANRNCGGSRAAVEQHVHLRIVISAIVKFSGKRAKINSLHRRRARRGRNQFRRAFLNGLGKICGSCDFVDESPRLCALTFYAVGISTEQVCEVAKSWG